MLLSSGGIRVIEAEVSSNRGVTYPLWLRRCIRVLITLLFAPAMLAHGAASADDDTLSSDLPEKDVLATLASLQSGQSMLLPKAKVVGDFNDEALRHRLHETGPRGRDFCVKAVWAPDRERALFAGANHGAPHRLNDVWEYDLATNTWHLLYAPDPSVLRGNSEAYEAVRETREHVVPGDPGEAEETVTLVHTSRGGPAHLSHTYWGLAYDPGRRMLMWNLLYANRGGSYDGPPIWAFSPEDQVWEPVLYSKPRVRGTGIMASEYVAPLGGIVWYGASWQRPGMWIQPSDGGGFIDLQPNDGLNPYRCTECPGVNAVMTVDDREGIIIAVSENRTYHYDIEANQWSMVVDGGSEDVPYGHYARSVFGYDPASGVALLYNRAAPGTVWAYDSVARSWTNHQVSGPDGPTRKIIGYVDPQRHVLIVIDRRDVWVYRH